jgi:hypothetical protein
MNADELWRDKSAKARLSIEGAKVDALAIRENLQTY